MEKEVINSYKKAGQILKEVQKLAEKTAKPGAKLLELAEKIESRIKNLDGKTAFPVNLSANNWAAHYTPKVNDESVIEEKDVMKIDIGVHVNGYIADSAFTMDFSGEYGKVVEASQRALENAISILKVGTTMKEIGKEIQTTIEGFHLKPIENLSGHGLEQFTAHAAPTFPNVERNDLTEIEEDTAFAIEPFASTGTGTVRDANIVEIFSLKEKKPVRNLNARNLLEKIEKEFKTIPFSERQIAEGLTEFQRKTALRELMINKCIKGYPLLKDIEGSIVAQFETSFAMDGDELNIMTDFPLKFNK